MGIGELIAALEGATGPSRELEAAIALALGWERIHPCRTVGNTGAWRTPGGHLVYDFPAYTASLDAALTLVPEGWGWSADCTSPKPYFRLWLYENGPSCQDQDAEGATPAIALCIAALKARAA